MEIAIKAKAELANNEVRKGKKIRASAGMNVKSLLKPELAMGSDKKESEMDDFIEKWYPNDKQIEQIRRGIFAKATTREVLEKMNSGVAYNLSKGKGFCLIMNQSNGREGSVFDVGSIRLLMEKQLNMKVKLLIDINASAFNKKIDKYLQSQKMRNYNCFILILMAHGKGDTLRMMDDLGPTEIHLKTDVLWKMGDWPAMEGKPKLVFVQACEASNDQRDYGIKKDSEEKIKVVDRSPKIRDVLMVRSTHKPIASSRRNKYGTLFIQALCEVVKRCAHRLDTTRLIQRIADFMSRITIKNSYQICKIDYSTLTRDFYFFSKFYLVKKNRKPKLKTPKKYNKYSKKRDREEVESRDEEVEGNDTDYDDADDDYSDNNNKESYDTEHSDPCNDDTDEDESADDDTADDDIADDDADENESDDDQPGEDEPADDDTADDDTDDDDTADDDTADDDADDDDADDVDTADDDADDDDTADEDADENESDEDQSDEDEPADDDTADDDTADDDADENESDEDQSDEGEPDDDHSNEDESDSDEVPDEDDSASDETSDRCSDDD